MQSQISFEFTPKITPRVEPVVEILPPERENTRKPNSEKKSYDTLGNKAIISKLKANNQDFEFYPTTSEIIHIVKNRMEKAENGNSYKSVLDCGAGNGKTLEALTKGKKFAIEKSQILVTAMNPDIFVVGCDFHHNVLIDKKVDIVFCNPPYTEYKQWAARIISEANAGEIFLVLPIRWKDQPEIMDSIKSRNASHSVIGTTDFLDAPRQARAKVDILKINLNSKGYNRDNSPEVDPFILWVEKEFPLNTRTRDDVKNQTFNEKINNLVKGKDTVHALVELYQNEMTILQDNFKIISNIDRSIFDELDINFSSITAFLRGRIKGLKEKYWRELFEHFAPLTKRLTKASRTGLLKTLTANVSVDFNESNIYAITTWAIKNANRYFDTQLIDTFIDLLERANVVRYKSNQKTWGKDEWRFRQDLRGGHIHHIGLDYRCVISCYNTFSGESWNSYEYPNGLHQRVHDRLNDIITVANNLGFICPEWEVPEQKEWEPGQLHTFWMNKGQKKILMTVRAYKNGNIHIKFNQKFLRKFNVEFGRLKGWLRNHVQAAEELNIPLKEAETYFKSNYALECTSVKLLTG